MTMTTVHVMVGVAGSGKSTYVKKEIENDKRSIRLSSDYIREAMPEIRDDNSEVFRVMNSALKTHIKDGYFKDIYYDATNTTRKRRRALYRNIKSWNNNVDVAIVFFSVPYFEAVKRNNLREGKERVPEHVILRMYRQLQVPRFNVDCDIFKVIGVPMFSRYSDDFYSPNRIEDVFNYINDEWVDEVSMTDTEHDCPPHHLEDVFTHINMAISNADTPQLKRLAFWHDLGKGITKVKDETGCATFRGHADVSAHYFLNYLYFTKNVAEGIQEHDFDELSVIRQHMNFHNDMGKKNIRNNLLTDGILKLGEEFAEIDSISKITE